VATKKSNEKTSAKMATIGPNLLRDSKTLPEGKQTPLKYWLGQKKGKAVISL